MTLEEISPSDHSSKSRISLSKNTNKVSENSTDLKDSASRDDPVFSGQQRKEMVCPTLPEDVRESDVLSKEQWDSNKVLKDCPILPVISELERVHPILSTNEIEHHTKLEDAIQNPTMSENKSDITASENQTEIPSEPVTGTISMIDVLKNKTLRKLMLIICFVWMVNSLVYYGLFLMSSAMVGDRILNFFIIAIVDVPACLSLSIILRHCGRRKTLIGGHLICAMSVILAGVLNFVLEGEGKVLSMQIVTCVGKFGISATYILLYFYTTEILPTNFRTSGLGIAAFSSRLGTFLSPFAGALLRVFPWGPGVIFGTLCFLVSGLLFLVPDTSHRKLPQTLSEIESWKVKDNGSEKK